MMEQCKTCIDRFFECDLLRCQTVQLKHELREFVRSFPLIGKHFEEYQCPFYELDKGGDDL